LLTFLLLVMGHGCIRTILPTRYPVLRALPIIFREGSVEVVGIDVCQYLPEYLAIFELVPLADFMWKVKGIHLQNTEISQSPKF